MTRAALEWGESAVVQLALGMRRQRLDRWA